MLLLLFFTPDPFYTFYKIYHFNQCREYRLLAVSIPSIVSHFHQPLLLILLITLQGNLFAIEQSFSISSAHSPWQPLIYFLSPRICLFWMFHKKELCKYVVFCVWFLSLSIMFSRCLDCFRFT